MKSTISLIAAAVAVLGMSAAHGAGHQGRCHAIGDRSRCVAWHSRAQYVSAVAANDRRQER